MDGSKFHEELAALAGWDEVVTVGGAEVCDAVGTFGAEDITVVHGGGVVLVGCGRNSFAQWLLEADRDCYFGKRELIFNRLSTQHAGIQCIAMRHEERCA